MTTTAGPPGTNMGSPPQTDASQSGRQAAKSASPTDPIAVAKERERVLTERKNAPRNENVFIPVTEGGLGHNNQFARYLFERSLRKHDPRAMPKLSQIEVAAFDAYWRRREQDAIDEIEAAEFDRLVLRLQLLIACGVRGIFVTANGKSVGKTRIIQLILATIKLYSGLNVYGMTSTLNNATATLSRMSDINPDARRAVEEFAAMLDELDTPAEISAAIPRTQADHVGIIGEGRKSANEPSTYHTAAFVKTVLELAPYVDFLGLDLGNDSVQAGSVPLWAMRLAHAAVLVLNQDDAVTTGTFLEDVAVYRTDRASGNDLNRDLLDKIKVRVRFAGKLRQMIEAHKAARLAQSSDGSHQFIEHASNAQLELIEAIQRLEQTTREALTGLNISTPKKIAHSVVVGNRATTVNEPLIQAHMRPPQSTTASGELDWAGAALPLREDPWLLGKTSDHEPNPGVLARLLPETRQEVLAITVALLEQMAILQGISVPDTYKSKPTPEVDYTK